jgi:hypothetical protein
MKILKPAKNARRLHTGEENVSLGRPAHWVTNSTPHPGPLHSPPRDAEKKSTPHPACGHLLPCSIGFRRTKARRQSFLLMCLLLAGLGTSIQAQNTLNVTNYGAIGDAVQFYANTISNSVVVTTTKLIPDSAIGEAIELIGCGTVTTPPYCQDMVATITKVVNGTNIYVSQIPQATLTNTFATYGFNNTPSFQAAIAAVGADTNDIINIPAGTYLFICPYVASVYGNAGIILTRGGLHFIGAGTNSTTLLSQGAWNIYGGAVYRSYLIDFKPPIKNDFPVSIENLTLDGGVQQGNTTQHGFPASITTGHGWDINHDAIVIRGPVGSVCTHQTWTNVVFQHWRGEMVKSNDGSTNGNLTIVNCVFTDGNATAINYYASLIVTNCIFNNLYQVAEYYQAYSTNTSYFVNNLCTNITGNGFAFNGGKGNNPPFILQNNEFYVSGNGIETTPGDNIFIISNYFYGGAAIVPGCPGYQGTFDNSNIVVTGNIFEKPTAAILMYGGTSATNANRIEGVQIYGNHLTNTPNGTVAVKNYGWTTNIIFYNNDFSCATNGSVTVSSGLYGSQYILAETNNLYYTTISDSVGTTNDISYANGSRFKIINPFHSGTVYALVDTNASQIPRGAQILIQNDNTSSASVPVYLNSALTRGPVTVPSGLSRSFQWTNGVWIDVVGPPSNLHVITNSP